MNIVQSSLFSDFWPPVIQELIKFIVRLKADMSVETKFPASNGTANWGKICWRQCYFWPRP